MSSGTGRAEKLCKEHGQRIARNAERIDTVNKTLYGANGTFGVATKIEILWRSQIWIVGLVGVAIGSIVTLLCRHLFAG